MRSRNNSEQIVSLSPLTPSPKIIRSRSYSPEETSQNDYVYEPEIYYKRARNNDELLYYACKFDNTKLIKQIISNVTNPNLYKYDNEYNRVTNPLIYAIANDNMAVFKLLLSLKTIDVNFYIDEDNNTLIHELIEFNNMKYIKLLILYPGIDLNIPNKSGETAVYIAVRNFHNDKKTYLKLIRSIITIAPDIRLTNSKLSIIKYVFMRYNRRDEYDNKLLELLIPYNTEKWKKGSIANKETKYYKKKASNILTKKNLNTVFNRNRRGHGLGTKINVSRFLLNDNQSLKYPAPVLTSPNKTHRQTHSHTRRTGNTRPKSAPVSSTPSHRTHRELNPADVSRYNEALAIWNIDKLPVKRP